MATGSHQNGGCWWSHEVPRALGEQTGEQRERFLYFLNEINGLGCHFESHQPQFLNPSVYAALRPA
jgi:hypothetical protein